MNFVVGGGSGAAATTVAHIKLDLEKLHYRINQNWRRIKPTKNKTMKMNRGCAKINNFHFLCPFEMNYVSYSNDFDARYRYYSLKFKQYKFQFTETELHVIYMFGHAFFDLDSM